MDYSTESIKQKKKKKKKDMLSCCLLMGMLNALLGVHSHLYVLPHQFIFSNLIHDI